MDLPFPPEMPFDKKCQRRDRKDTKKVAPGDLSQHDTLLRPTASDRLHCSLLMLCNPEFPFWASQSFGEQEDSTPEPSDLADLFSASWPQIVLAVMNNCCESLRGSGHASPTACQRPFVYPFQPSAVANPLNFYRL